MKKGSKDGEGHDKSRRSSNPSPYGYTEQSYNFIEELKSSAKEQTNEEGQHKPLTSEDRRRISLFQDKGVVKLLREGDPPPRAKKKEEEGTLIHDERKSRDDQDKLQSARMKQILPDETTHVPGMPSPEIMQKQIKRHRRSSLGSNPQAIHAHFKKPRASIAVEKFDAPATMKVITKLKEEEPPPKPPAETKPKGNLMERLLKASSKPSVPIKPPVLPAIKSVPHHTPPPLGRIPSVTKQKPILITPKQPSKLKVVESQKKVPVPSQVQPEKSREPAKEETKGPEVPPFFRFLKPQKGNPLEPKKEPQAEPKEEPQPPKEEEKQPPPPKDEAKPKQPEQAAKILDMMKKPPQAPPPIIKKEQPKVKPAGEGDNADVPHDRLQELREFGIPEQKRLIKTLLDSDTLPHDFGGLMRQYYSYVLRSYCLVNVQDRYRSGPPDASYFDSIDLSKIGTREEEQQKMDAQKLKKVNTYMKKIKAVSVDEEHFQYLKDLIFVQPLTIPITIIHSTCKEVVPPLEDVFYDYHSFFGPEHAHTKKAAFMYHRMRKRLDMYNYITGEHEHSSDEED